MGQPAVPVLIRGTEHENGLGRIEVVRYLCRHCLRFWRHRVTFCGHECVPTALSNETAELESPPERDHSGSNNPNAKLTDEQVDELRDQYRDGISPMSLSRKYGISLQQTRNIVAGRAWKRS